MVSVLGIPLDENSSYLKGTASAPAAIREAFKSDSSNAYTEDGVNLSESNEWKDLGDISLSKMPEAFGQIEKAISSEIEKEIKY